MSWTDKQLDFQEQLLREQMTSLHNHIEYAEQSLALTLEVNREDAESMDPMLPLKAQRFREYLQKLRESLEQLQSIQRAQDDVCSPP